MDVFPVLNDFQTVIKSIFNINISGADIDSLQHTTEATQKMLVQELRQPFVWWFNLSGKRKAFRLDSKFKKNFKKIGGRKKAAEIIMIYWTCF
jgi:hypothetical protein